MSLTIEHVKSAFAHWRLTRESKGRIPEDLRTMVGQLIPAYKKSKICKELHLSGEQLQKIICATPKKQLLAHDGMNCKKNDGFIEATLPIFPSCELSVTGKSKTLCIKFPTEQLLQVLPMMVAQL